MCVCFCACLCVCLCVCLYVRESMCVCYLHLMFPCARTHTHTKIRMHKSYNNMTVGEKKFNRARGIVCQEEFIRYTTKVCLCVVHIGLCARACMCVCVCVCIQIFQQTSKSPSVLHCYTPSALRLTSCAFSDCILCLRVYTPPDILSVLHCHTSRMLTYADVC